MSTIVTRAGKGSPLTNTEVDANFTNLNSDKYQEGDTPTFADLNITGSTPELILTDDDSALRYSRLRQANGAFKLEARNNTNHGTIEFQTLNNSVTKTRMKIGSNGDTSFFNDDGSTIKMKWDSSADRLGVGTSSPSETLDVAGKIKTSEGILLGGTGNVNLLEDYEEGDFDSTLALADANSGGNEASIGTLQTYYTKIGRLVTCHIRLLNINTAGMTASNQLILTGLPFTAITPHVAIGVAYVTQINLHGANGVFALGSGNSTRAQFRTTSSNGSSSALSVSSVNSGSASVIMTFQYLAA